MERQGRTRQDKTDGLARHAAVSQLGVSDHHGMALVFTPFLPARGSRGMMHTHIQEMYRHSAERYGPSALKLEICENNFPMEWNVSVCVTSS